jgi:ribose 5-phosphate isomerase
MIGVVESGLFIAVASEIIVGSTEGVKVFEKNIPAR